MPAAGGRPRLWGYTPLDPNDDNDARVPTRKISDQLGHARVSMTQDHYLGRRPTDRETTEGFESMLGPEESDPRVSPRDLAGRGTGRDLAVCRPLGARTRNRRTRPSLLTASDSFLSVLASWEMPHRNAHFLR